MKTLVTSVVFVIALLVPSAVDANQGAGDVGNLKRQVEIEGSRRS